QHPREAIYELAALGCFHLRPLAVSFPRRRYGGVDVGRGRKRGHRQLLFGRGIDRGEVTAFLRRDEFAADEEPVLLVDADVIGALGRRRVAPPVIEREVERKFIGLTVHDCDLSIARRIALPGAGRPWYGLLQRPIHSAVGARPTGDQPRASAITPPALLYPTARRTISLSKNNRQTGTCRSPVSRAASGRRSRASWRRSGTSPATSRRCRASRAASRD